MSDIGPETGPEIGPETDPETGPENEADGTARKVEFTTGTYVSAVGHAGLIGWLLLGWGLSADPLPFEVTEVSVVSGAEYAALVAATSPSAATDQPGAPAAPATEEPVVPVTPEDPVVPQEAETPPAPPAEEAPPPEAPAPVPPPAQVDETAPVLDAPAAPLSPDLPVVTDRPQERLVDRVADVPTPLPPPDADVAPQVQEQVVEAPAEVATPLEEAQEAAAPEETVTEIVTEADIASGAPERSLRPPSRPASLAPPPAPPTEAETATADSANVQAAPDRTVDDLLADLTEAPAAPQAPVGNPGPPMTDGQRSDFRVSVQGCWTVDPGAEAGVTVTVAFELGRDRKVIGSRITLIGSTGSDAAVNAAFTRARSAILRCQNVNAGFTLDDAQYEQWRQVEITFDPSGMRRWQ